MCTSGRIGAGSAELGRSSSAGAPWKSVKLIAAAAAAWSYGGSAARAQLAGGILPSTAGGLRSAVESLLPNAPVTSAGQALTYGASLGVSEGLTNYSSAGQGSTYLTTTLQPEISVQGNTRRITLNLDYAPSIYLYAGNSVYQNQIAENLNANGTVIIIPDLFFVDARGFVTTQPRFGGAQPFGSQFINNNDAVTTASFSVSPYLEHRFGGWGTGKIGDLFQRTTESGDNNVSGLAFPSNTFGAPGYGTTGNLTSNNEFASFVTGENLNRVQNEIDLSATQYSGGGQVYRGAYRNDANNQLSYAIDRTITLLFSIGYEDIHYSASGLNPTYTISDVTWSVGARWTPNPDSSIQVQYGRQNGATDFNANASYTPTARIRLTTTYTDGVTTGLEQQQALVNTTTVGPNGLLVNAQTGAPVSAANGFGLFNNISRVKQLNAGAFYLLTRDTFGLSYQYEQDTSIFNSTSVVGVSVPGGTTSTSNTATLSWQHDINPTTNLANFVSVGTVGTGLLLNNSGTQDSYSVSTTLSHTFTETLTGTATYSFYEQKGGAGNVLPGTFGGNYTQNSFFVGLRKSF